MGDGRAVDRGLFFGVGVSLALKIPFVGDQKIYHYLCRVLFERVRPGWAAVRMQRVEEC